MGENPSSLGEDFSSATLAECSITGRPATASMIYVTIWYGSPSIEKSNERRRREAVPRVDTRNKANDVELIRGHISTDHVHLFVSAPPRLSVSKLMQLLIGKSSRKLMAESKLLSRHFWGMHLWARGYFAASSGNVTDEVGMKYIEEQQVEHGTDDDFKIDGE